MSGTKCNNKAGMIAMSFLLAAFAVLVDGLHDGTLSRFIGSRHRIAFTGHDPKCSTAGLNRVAICSIPDEGFRLEGISNLLKTHRIAQRTQRTTVPHGLPQGRTKRARHPPRIIIIGGPASGKGTQCEYIESEYGVVHLSTGDMLRQAVRDGSNVGKMAGEFMNRGELVPDHIMIKIVSDRLSKEDCRTRGWLLDGFPRTRRQAEALEKMGIQSDIVLLLDVPDNILIERVVGRRLDPVTGKTYHLKFRPPPAAIEDRLEQRSDDTMEKIKNRLSHFHANLSEIRSHLGKGIVKVDGTGTPSDISSHVVKAIDHHLMKRLVKA